MDIIDRIKFNSKGLIPAIIQDYKSKEILMLAYMNQESLLKTIETRKTWFYSRSRQKLWNKGETSGNYQKVKDIYYDCDGDTLLIKVEQKGMACHTGAYSCFYAKLLEESKVVKKEGNGQDKYNIKEIVDYLYDFIKGRKMNPEEGSYTNYLFQEGLDKILKKVGEECSEVIIGAKNKDKKEVIYEVSDLVYHLLVLLTEMNISPDEIRKELYERHSN